MSGWHHDDNHLATDTGTSFPAANNITVAGILPHDRVPSAGKSIRLINDEWAEFNQVVSSPDF